MLTMILQYFQCREGKIFLSFCSIWLSNWNICAGGKILNSLTNTAVWSLSFNSTCFRFYRTLLYINVFWFDYIICIFHFNSFTLSSSLFNSVVDIVLTLRLTTIFERIIFWFGSKWDTTIYFHFVLLISIFNRWSFVKTIISFNKFKETIETVEVRIMNCIK